MTNLDCDICDEKVSSINLLWYHYCVHYMSELKSISIDLRKGNQCLVCEKHFVTEDKLIYHIGVIHQMLNEIRWNESKCLLSAQKEDLGVVKHDTSKNTCEFCGKSHKLTFDLLECYSYHFADDLKDMMQDEVLQSLSKHTKSCPICQDEFTTEQKMHIHLGTVHQLVNDILVSEGIMPIIPEPEELDIYLDGVDSLQADLADTSINGDEHYDIDEDECDAYRFDDIEGELQVIEDLSEFSIVN